LFAMIARNSASIAGRLIDSFPRIAMNRPVSLPWPPVMIPSGSGARPPS